VVHILSQKPKLTVFLITYNREKYIKSSIDSILNQSYKNFKFIILDNASTDQTEKIVKSFNNPKIKYIRHQINIGAVENTNFAINTCDTKYLTIFHDDDIMYSDMLESQINEMENNPDYSIISTRSSYIDQNNNEIKKKLLYKYDREVYTGNQYLIHFFSTNKGLVCPSVMFRHDFLVLNKLRFNFNVGLANDQYMWFEIGKYGGKICVLNKILMKYRLHQLQGSNNDQLMEIDLLEAVKDNLLNDENKNKILPVIKKYSINQTLILSNKKVKGEITKIKYLYGLTRINKVNKSFLFVKLNIYLIMFFTLNIPLFIRLGYKIYKNEAKRNLE
jgi:glycosyltransferase involved in cell wall biosynthesis